MCETISFRIHSLPGPSCPLQRRRGWATRSSRPSPGEISWTVPYIFIYLHHTYLFICTIYIYLSAPYIFIMACNTQPSWVYIPCNICIAYTIYCALRIKQDFKWALPPGDTWPDTTCKQPFPSPQTTTTTRGFTGIQKLQVFVQSRGSNQILAGLTINQKYITFYFLVFCLWLASCW